MLLLVCLSAAFVSVNCDVIAFSSGKTVNATYTNQETILYDKVFTNLGNGYDPSTGVFMAPVTGLYSFQFHTLSHRGQSAWLELYHNGNYVVSAYGHTVDDYSNGGNNVVLKLQTGDRVEVKAVDISSGYQTVLYGAPDEIYSTFSGYLIAPVFEEIPAVG